jgi:hypothetical protein
MRRREEKRGEERRREEKRGEERRGEERGGEGRRSGDKVKVNDIANSQQLTANNITTAPIIINYQLSITNVSSVSQ